MSTRLPADADCPGGLPEIDCSLLRALRSALALVDHPFAELGRRCGLSEDKVLERLRLLLGHGEITHLGPITAVTAGPADALDARLLEAIASGLPLVPRPYEAVAAMLGITEAEVRAHLQSLFDAGAFEPGGAVLRRADCTPDGPPGER